MKNRLTYLIVCLAMLLTACGQKTPTWQEQYDLGVRYLSEGSYEEAIIAFTAVIEIDPMQESSYRYLAEAYAGIGDYDMAVKILEDGYAETHSVMLQQLLDEYRFRTAQDGFADADSDFLTQNWIKAEEWTINSVPFWEASQSDVTNAFPYSGGPSEWQDGNIGFPSYSSGGVSFGWSTEQDALWFMNFDSWDGSTKTIQESRGISTQTTFKEFLLDIGATEEGVSYILSELPDAAYDITLEPFATGNDQYSFELTVWRTETTSEGTGDSYFCGLRYDFADGKSLTVNCSFFADDQTMDYGSIKMIYP